VQLECGLSGVKDNLEKCTDKTGEIGPKIIMIKSQKTNGDSFGIIIYM